MVSCTEFHLASPSSPKAQRLQTLPLPSQVPPQSPCQARQTRRRASPQHSQQSRMEHSLGDRLTSRTRNSLASSLRCSLASLARPGQCYRPISPLSLLLDGPHIYLIILSAMYVHGQLRPSFRALGFQDLFSFFSPVSAYPTFAYTHERTSAECRGVWMVTTCQCFLLCCFI